VDTTTDAYRLRREMERLFAQQGAASAQTMERCSSPTA
jgi:hypothetical protein